MSEAGVANIRKAHAVHPISAVQSEYSLWERNLEADVLPVLRELGIGLVHFGPLGRGFLTGTARRAEDYPETDFRHLDPRLQGINFDLNMQAAGVVNSIARDRHLTAGQIALTWVLHQGEDIVPIPGTKHRHYLEQNMAALDVVLDAGEIDQLGHALMQVAGPRYNEQRMAMVDR